MKDVTNQILVTDKIFITPEFKVKKQAYKWYFIVSVFLVCCLFSYYIYAEYDKNKSEEVSKALLADINFETQEEEVQGPIDTTIRTKDNVIIVILDPTENSSDELNINDIEQTEFVAGDVETSTSRETVSSSKPKEKSGAIDETVHTAKDGTEYKTVAVIDIPKIGVHYPVIEPLDKGLQDYTAILKLSPCRYYGPEPNEVGNYCIVGHNYRNSKFFSKVPTLENGDIIQLTDTYGRTLDYKVYDKYVVDPTNQDCTDQNTKGKKEVTIITCTNDSKQRWILKCVET